MTLSGVLSGVLQPYGSGFALSRAASRLAPVERGVVEPVRGVEGGGGQRGSEEMGERGRGSRFDTVDTVELSPAARGYEAAREDEVSGVSQPDAGRGADGKGLDEEQLARVEELKQRDTEVREHEQAHLSAAGSYARGGASFEYERGPDGRNYAVRGEVQIDTSPVPDDPEATIRKMQVVYAAALAPAEPSAQDRRVAEQAQARIRAAQAELAEREGERGSAGAVVEGMGDAGPDGDGVELGRAVGAYERGGVEVAEALRRADSSSARGDNQFGRGPGVEYSVGRLDAQRPVDLYA